MQIQTINWRTLEAFLGHNKYRVYLDRLHSEYGVSAETARASQFLVSRASNFDHGAFTDLGCWNVVIYTAGNEKGFNVIVDDQMGIPKKEEVVLVTLPGSTSHNWRRCGCDSCKSYRVRFCEFLEPNTQ